ncbi:DUF2973 domain-containing protein [Coleofasciculus sp. H7-2]|uniref:DUF2973 domain-containing protein n=1 Tax=Coleofasciculus sp. H7-2 TaxID=3351545 RepID=UPI00367338B1
MLHLLYLIAFTILAFLAIGNMLRNLLTISSMDAQRRYPPGMQSQFRASRYPYGSVPHPELLDDAGNPINEPLLVMRSMTVEDAREQLDALYKSSPGNNGETSEEA